MSVPLPRQRHQGPRIGCFGLWIGLRHPPSLYAMTTFPEWIILRFMNFVAQFNCSSDGRRIQPGLTWLLL